MHAAPYHPHELTEQQFAPTVIALAMGDAGRRRDFGGRLSLLGYDVVPLETGPQLLQYLYNSVAHQPRPDLVVCDAELEGIDGAQVCLISRAQDAMLPFIVLARRGEAGAFDSLELADDACVLTTPINFEELRQSVVRLAGSP